MNFVELERKLEKLYPNEADMTLAKMYIAAKADGIITPEVFLEAKKYYGNRWNYSRF